MINLLPPSIKTDMLYARKNAFLARWLTILGIALLGVGVLVVIGYIYLNQSVNNFSKQVAVSRQNLQAQKVEETQKKVEAISNDTKLATQVLSREVLFSKLLRQLGSALPANTALQQFQVDKLQGGLTLQATAADINAATQLQVNLQDPKNQIFDKADIENITCTPADAENPAGCNVQIRALFAKNNPYLYITPTSNKGTAKQ